MRHRRACTESQVYSSGLLSGDIPSDLAKKIIEKELELEKNTIATVIHELNTLYSKAIEYFEQQNDPKYLDFQERLQKMLIKPNVLAALQQQNSNKSLESPVNSKPVLDSAAEKMRQRKEEADVTRKELSGMFSKTLQSSNPGKTLDMIIDRQSDHSKETANKALIDFKSQDSALERRLEQRKKRQISQSMNFSKHEVDDLSFIFNPELTESYEENSYSTKSSLFTSEDHSLYPKCNYEGYETRLEAVMENVFSERAFKIAEVTYKYESQINEFEGMGEMMGILMNQMRENMQEEIKNIIDEYDKKKNDDIQKIKEEFLNISCSS